MLGDTLGDSLRVCRALHWGTVPVFVPVFVLSPQGDRVCLASELKAKGLYTAAKYGWDKIAEDDSNFV